MSGKGRYSDDVNLPGQAYAVMVRSHYAHGVIRHIDTEAAQTMPGALAIYTAADLAAGGIGLLPARQIMKNRDGTPMLMPVRVRSPPTRCGMSAIRSPRSSPRRSPPPRMRLKRWRWRSTRCRR